MFRPSCILLTILAFSGWSTAVQINTLHEWKYIDYEWKYPSQRQKAVRTGVYNYERIIPVDFQYISDDRVLITTPRFYNNPASLSIISNKIGKGGPLLKPYPSWDWHQRENCSGMTSVSRVIVDKCDRLWVVDSGKIGNKQTCPAQILAFNTTTDQLLKRVKIPNRFSHNSKDSRKGRLEIQLVETKGDSCHQTWVYIGDPEGNGMVIWDGSDIWRLEDDIFAPDVLASTYLVGLEKVNLSIGVSIFLLPPPGFIDKDYMFFKPLSSLRDFTAQRKDFHRSKTGSSVPYYEGTFVLPTQELVRAFSDSGILVAGLSTGSLLACYYLENPLALEFVGIPVSDPVQLQFASSGKIVKGKNSCFKEERYLELSNRFQKFVLGTLDFDDINFRIVSVYVAELIEGVAVCQPGNRTVKTIEDKFFYKQGNITNIIL